MRAWTRFANPTNSEVNKAGVFTVQTRAFAGDGGTEQEQVELSLPPGEYAISLLEHAHDLDCVYLVAPGAKPVRWRAAGGVVVDTAVGCFATREAIDAIAELDDDEDDDDEGWLADKVDDLLFVECKGYGTILAHEHPVFVFRLVGDGIYGVAEGIDAAGRTCVVIFGASSDDWEEGDEASEDA